MVDVVDVVLLDVVDVDVDVDVVGGTVATISNVAVATGPPPEANAHENWTRPVPGAATHGPPAPSNHVSLSETTAPGAQVRADRSAGASTALALLMHVEPPSHHPTSWTNGSTQSWLDTFLSVVAALTSSPGR